MMDGSIAQGMVLRSGLDRQARQFFAAILFVSIAPVVIFNPIVAGTTLSASPVDVTLMAIFLIANAHVAISGFFWFDADYRQHISGSPAYYYVLPATLVAIFALLVQAWEPGGVVVFFILATVWNLHHFGRQNWGLVCLAASGTRSGPATQAEFWVCEASAISAVLPLLTALPIPGAEPMHGVLRVLALLIAGGAAVAGLVLAARLLVQGAHPVRAAMIAVGGLFFLPIHLVAAPLGIIAVAIAHSYQYGVIMGFLAAARHPAAASRWVLPMMMLTVVYIGMYAAYRVVDWGRWEALATVLISGIAMWHYLIDADLWKLRRAFQRQAVRARLPFLFR